MQGSAKENAGPCGFVYDKGLSDEIHPDGLLQFTEAMEFCAALRATQRVSTMAADPLFQTHGGVLWSCPYHR